MPRIPWKFEDAIENVTEYMAVNPNEGASPHYRKQLTKTRTTAPGELGQVIIYEGQDDVSQFDFSGTILNKAQYDLLYYAWKKRHPVKLTDDLGRQFIIYLESFEPSRKAPTHPSYVWRHTYNATSVILKEL